MGDWGNANFHIVAGWIAANLRWRSAPGSTFLIHTGTGYRTNVDAVATGLVDLAVTTPYCLALEWATAGRHFFAGTPYPHLRALGYIPQDDRLVFAVRADAGITSFAGLKQSCPPLRIATTCRNRDNLMSYAVEKVFLAHGIDPREIETWGGKWLEHDHPRRCVPLVTRGEADAVFQEAIMVPPWHELVETVPMRFLPMEEGALQQLQTEYGFLPAVLPGGRLRAGTDIPCLDWSHWAVFVRDDMPDDLAYLITAVMVEERAELEGRYRHLPLEHSPLTYPIDPFTMWQGLGAPLHPGAEGYYREQGYIG